MNDWKDRLPEEDRLRLHRLEARGGFVRWSEQTEGAEVHHFVYGHAHGIPIVGAGPMASPLDQGEFLKAAHDVIERVATVLGVLEA